MTENALDRFVVAQRDVYAQAVDEIRSGRKRTHWMWFIFPQIAGLGSSATAQHFAIRDRDEAREYLGHPILGPRLIECAQALLDLDGRTASAIFGYPDDLKLKSSATLFAEVSQEDSVFQRLLDRYFDGERDQRTLDLLSP